MLQNIRLSLKSSLDVNYAHPRASTNTTTSERQQIASPVRAEIHTTKNIVTCVIPTTNIFGHPQANLDTFEKEKKVAIQTIDMKATKSLQSKVIVNASLMGD